MNISFITRWFRFLIRPARTKRFEILLPLNYNDGIEIEAEKFDQTAEELCDRFGGVTEDTVRVSGTWKYGGTRYRDVLFRIRHRRDLKKTTLAWPHLNNGWASWRI